MFTDIAGSPVGLVCGANVPVIKEYNPRRYYETKHQEIPDCSAEAIA